MASIAALILLILLSALFSSSETAFTSLTLVQIGRLEKNKGRRGRSIARLTARPDILLTTILVGNNLANIGATALATQITIDLFGNEFIGAMTGIMTLIMLIFAEVTPKQFAIYQNEKLSLIYEPVINLLVYLFRPVTLFISFFSSFIVKLLGGKKKRSLTLEGLLQMVNLAENLGIVKTYEEEMVRNVFRINETPVSAILTHRTKVFALEESEKVREVIDRVLIEGYSRVPVYKDNPDEITGILLIKDLMNAYSQGETDIAIKELMNKPVFVPITKKSNDLFNLFRKEKLNMAVVLDEYGGFTGVVSREDVIEEILGELYDEDEIEDSEKIIKIKPNVYRIAGDTPFYLLEDKLNLQLEHGKLIQTLGGYIIEQLGRIPQKREVLETDKGRFVIDGMQKNRVGSVHFYQRELQQPD